MLMMLMRFVWLQTRSKRFNILAASPIRRIYSAQELLLLADQFILMMKLENCAMTIVKLWNIISFDPDLVRDKVSWLL